MLLSLHKESGVVCLQKRANLSKGVTTVSEAYLSIWYTGALTSLFPWSNLLCKMGRKLLCQVSDLNSSPCLGSGSLGEICVNASERWTFVQRSLYQSHRSSTYGTTVKLSRHFWELWIFRRKKILSKNLLW